MAFAHGKSTVLKLTDTGGVLRELTTYLKSVEGLPGEEADVADTSTMGTTYRTFVRGLITGSFQIAGSWDNTATSGPDAVLNGLLNDTAIARVFEYGPGGGATGNVKYTGSAWCTGYAITSEFDGIVAFTASFQITGSVTKTTFA